jgi:hypothetical protein
MSDQHFQGPVGQVAGRDIVNVGITDLWSFDAETLQNELQRCKRKLWEARSALLLNAPLFGLIATAIGGGALQLWTVFRMGGSLPLMAIWVLCIAFFGWRLQLIRDRKGKMVRYYRERIEAVDLVLQDIS